MVGSHLSSFLCSRYIQESELAMAIADESATTVMMEGKRMAIILYWILGLGSLLAWNTIITIGDYYYKIFPNYHPSRALPLVYLAVAIGTLTVLTQNESRIDTRRRNIAGYCLYFMGSVLYIVLDLATFGRGGLGAYIALCAISAALGVAHALVLGGMVGDLYFMCPEFIQSYFAGFAASGALTTALRLITKAAFDKSYNGLRKGALLFLAISTSSQFLCILLYAYYLPKLPIVKSYRSKASLEGSKTVSSDLAAAGIHQVAGEVQCEDRLTIKDLLYQNIDYAIGLYLNTTLTLSIFPGFLYENTGSHHLHSWYALVLLASYNVWDLISRYIPLINCLRLESRKGLLVAILARLLFIPAFYFTAKYADKGWMIMLVCTLGLTNGYLTVCIMTAAPKGYKGPEQNALGNLLMWFINAGLCSGLVLGWLWIIGKGKF
ncbi:Epsin-3, clathrin recruitment and traffic between the Golgi and endosome [Ancistrocladus abbreviatus]